MSKTANETHDVKVDITGHIELPTLKSLYIEMYFEETLLSSGTAFLVAHDRESHCCLMTNRHNVTGRHQETGKCISPHAAVPDSMTIYFHKNGAMGEWVKVRLPLYRDDNTPYWFEHSKLGSKVDAVAMNLTWGGDVQKIPYYLSEPLGLDRHGLFVGPADTVSVIGYPFGVSAAGKFPIWATGFLAQDLSFVNPSNPSFLIDCRTRQGQSGSAVIAYRAGGYRKIADGRMQSVMSAEPTWEFLGIYSGRINAESDLGRVWNVSVIEDLWKSSEQDQQRRESLAIKNKQI